ncbi:unnamed protein product [Schistosoma guineensis]|nr:unnamed protein product [Schistosoma guineensis]
MYDFLARRHGYTIISLHMHILPLYNLKRDELVLSRFNNEIKKQINLVVKKFLNDREKVTKYVNCMKFATKQYWMPEIIQEFQDVISDINSYKIEVPESSTLHQCINTEISKYNDIFRLSTLVSEIYEVMKNYNIHLF